ncbi:MAG: hypothetical protein IH624_09685 [Phycisphaerae bacterium]|nr:hypothetical protein [Phycisphaerae bacterium]
METAVGGAFNLGIDSRRASIQWIAAISNFHRLCRVPFGDQPIFLRREYFMRTGRFADIP